MCRCEVYTSHMVELLKDLHQTVLALSWPCDVLPAVPLQLAAGLAAGLEDGLFGTLGPIFRQLRRLAQEEMPAPFWQAAPAGGGERGEEVGLEGGAHPGREPGAQQEDQEDEDEGGGCWWPTFKYVELAAAG